MATVVSTSATESIKYFGNLEIKHQESTIKLGKPFQTVIWGSASILAFQGSVGVTSQIQAVLNQLHQDWIRIPKPNYVREYLLRYPDLINILPYVSKMVRERVGLYTQLSLEVYHDPEIEDEYLTLYIRQEHYDENILNIIEDIRTQYEEKLIGRSGWFLLTTDFRPPK